MLVLTGSHFLLGRSFVGRFRIHKEMEDEGNHDQDNGQ